MDTASDQSKTVPAGSGPPDLPDFYLKLNPQDRVTLQQARQTLSQARADAATAKAKADEAKAKPQKDFTDAQKAVKDAVAAKKAKLGQVSAGFKALAAAATTSAGAVDTQAGKADGLAAGDPVAAVADQLAPVQDKYDALKILLADAVKTQAAVDAAVAALQKVSDPQPDPFDPSKAIANASAITLASAQYDVDAAKGEAQLDKAEDAYKVAKVQMDPSKT